MRWLMALLFALAAACTGSGASQTCQEVCKRDAECHDELAEQQEEDETEERAIYRFDRDECETTCAALERDSKGRKLVKSHASCVKKAGDCKAVRACN